MTRIYQCTTCGVITEAPEQLCQPQRLENAGLYCGEAGSATDMCREMKGHLAYVCGSCGRGAQQPEMVCEPLLAG